jgi:hypothetical protein
LTGGIEKSASCHECDGAQRCDAYAFEQILQFTEIAWQITVYSPDRQTMVTLTNYRSRPVITAREVTQGKSGCPF